MKVLITGGFGFIGSHIAELLLKNQTEVVIIDDLSSGTLDNIPGFDMSKFYKLDITKDNLEYVFIKEKPDCCIHLAAQTSVAHSIKNMEEDATTNILGSINVLNLCKKYNIKKLISASSAAVYGIPKYLPIDENHPTNPISNYGLSKLTMEKYIELSGIPYIIFRFGNVYGPRQISSKESGVIAIFNNNMLHNKEISIYGDGYQTRDFIYVVDIANICYTTLKSNVVNKIINFSSGTGISINELYKKMQTIYNYKQKPIHSPERKGEIKDSILSNKEIQNLIPNYTTTSLDQGLLNLKNSFTKEGKMISC